MRLSNLVKIQTQLAASQRASPLPTGWQTEQTSNRDTVSNSSSTFSRFAKSESDFVLFENFELQKTNPVLSSDLRNGLFEALLFENEDNCASLPKKELKTGVCSV